MPRKSPDKKTLAKLKVATDMGLSPSAAAQVVGVSHVTALNYLRNRPDVFNDPDTKKLIDRLKESELADLHTLTGKARMALHNYLDDVLAGKKEPNPVAVVAIQDRSFQQARLLDGKSTMNIHGIVEQAQERLAEIDRELAELKAEG